MSARVAIDFLAGFSRSVYALRFRHCDGNVDGVFLACCSRRSRLFHVKQAGCEVNELLPIRPSGFWIRGLSFYP
ncbi:hypothetical protein A2J04_00110 [Rhodococcus sp. EPR-279]|nr:hypothetical protein A2J04_00110 [Rhodococcus sp. EPR-279]KZF08777.1 hypothetical protein A2J02_20015 [Rhodococcus sp. EPR-147]